MKRIHILIGALGLVGCLSLATCGGSGNISLNSLVSGTSNDTSVSDATLNGGGPNATPGQMVPPIEAVRARVRNESSARADVTVRFIRDNTVVHLAFVRVLPKTITTVASPESADVVELSGLDDRGRALSDATYLYGVDFTATAPAEYTVVDAGTGTPPPVSPPEPPSGHPAPPRLTMVEPSHDLTVSLGSTFAASWDDSGGSAGAVVSLFLQPVASSGTRDLQPAGPGVSAALDGINDQLEVLVENVDPGAYRVVGRMEDGSSSASSTAPGVVQVVRDPTDVAPTLKILSPASTVELQNGDTLTVQWDDADPDDNATIIFALVSSGQTDGPAESFIISPPIAEDPDGPAADSAMLAIHDVFPGVYDLLGTIDDGRLIGTDRVGRAVRVLPPVENDPPQMVLYEPASDADVGVGQSLFVRWTDSDANDNARISLLLDPDFGNVPLDGNEVLLVASLGEDADGPGDQITLGIPAGVAEGSYRLVGVITDGLTEMLTSAPGLVHVHLAPSDGQPPDGGGIDGGDGGGDGGGRVLIIPVLPPPPPSPSPTTVTPLDPSTGAVVIAPGEVVTTLIAGRVSRPADSHRVYLSNLRYGGRVRVEVEPTQLQQIDVKTLLAPVRADAVPNDAWPRSFDMELETAVDGVVQVDIGLRPIWIVQEAEVLNVALIGDPCMPSVQGSSTVPLMIAWYGGGIVEAGLNPAVQFWLTKDGGVPDAGADDATHHLIVERPGSPNSVRVMQVDVGSSRVAANTADVGLGVALEPGDYRVVTVYDPDGVNRVVSGTSSDLISVCDPGP